MISLVGAVFTHLGEEEQGQACDWDHMQGKQVMRVISHTGAELVIQTARGSLVAHSLADCSRHSHLSCRVHEQQGSERIGA